jgi:hypothetical protein
LIGPHRVTVARTSTSVVVRVPAAAVGFSRRERRATAILSLAAASESSSWAFAGLVDGLAVITSFTWHHPN